MTRIEEQRESVTMDQAKQDIIARGLRVSSGCWEDEDHVYAFSLETAGPATYGHPRAVAHYSKRTRWYTVQ